MKTLTKTDFCITLNSNIILKFYHFGTNKADIAYVGSIGWSSYFSGFSNDNAAIPKNV